MSISQLKYWLTSTSEYTRKDGEQTGAYLSYDVFRVLSVLGGYFGLDHLYLRSPWTFLGKFVVNILFFGVWWIYDIAHAFFNEPILKVYGLGVPGLGPMGIAAGVLVKDDKPGNRHWAFMVYALVLFFGGIIGLDDFLLGNRQMGIIRLICCVSVILMPVAFLIWAYHIFQLFTNTESVVDSNKPFFGAPGMSAQFDKNSFFGSLFELKAINSIASAIESGTRAVENTTQAFGTAVSGIATVADSVKTATDIISKGLPAIGNTAAVAFIDAAHEKLSQEKVGQEKEKEKGQAGGGLNAVSYTFIGTILLIVISGLTLTFSRNVSTSKPDDTPPEPGVSGKTP